MGEWQRVGSCQPNVCGSVCCTFLYFFQMGMSDVEREFFKARGLPIVAFPAALEAVRVEHRCQHLTDDGSCGVYGLPERPEACGVYPSTPLDLIGVEGCTFEFVEA